VSASTVIVAAAFAVAGVTAVAAAVGTAVVREASDAATTAGETTVVALEAAVERTAGDVAAIGDDAPPPEAGRPDEEEFIRAAKRPVAGWGPDPPSDAARPENGVPRVVVDVAMASTLGKLFLPNPGTRFRRGECRKNGARGAKEPVAAPNGGEDGGIPSRAGLRRIDRRRSHPMWVLCSRFSPGMVCRVGQELPIPGSARDPGRV
jgi:hypothetical protein